MKTKLLITLLLISLSDLSAQKPMWHYDEEKKLYAFMDTITNQPKGEYKYNFIKPCAQDRFIVGINSFNVIVNSSGKELSKLITRDILFFDKLKLFAIADDNNKFGLYDINAKLLTAPAYDELEQNKGYIIATNYIKKPSTTMALFGSRGEMIKGVLDKTGKVIVPVEYKYFRQCDDGNTVVSKDNSKYGLLSDKYKFIFQPQYDVIYCKMGWIKIINNAKITYYDSKGLLLIPDKFYNSEILSHDYLRVKNEAGQYGVVNRKGAIIIPIDYKAIRHIHSNYFIVQNQEGKWGAVNHKNEITIPLVYQIEFDFRGNLARIGEPDGYSPKLFGYINTQGDTVVEIKYRKAYPFENGYALVVSPDSKTSTIDSTGKEIFQWNYGIVSPTRYGVVITQDKQKYQLHTIKGDLIVPDSFDYIDDFIKDPNSIQVGKGNMVGYINTKGEIVKEFRVGPYGRGATSGGQH